MAWALTRAEQLWRRIIAATGKPASAVANHHAATGHAGLELHHGGAARKAHSRAMANANFADHLRPRRPAPKRPQAGRYWRQGLVCENIATWDSGQGWSTMAGFGQALHNLMNPATAGCNDISPPIVEEQRGNLPD